MPRPKGSIARRLRLHSPNNALPGISLAPLAPPKRALFRTDLDRSSRSTTVCAVDHMSDAVVTRSRIERGDKGVSSDIGSLDGQAIGLEQLCGMGSVLHPLICSSCYAPRYA